MKTSMKSSQSAFSPTTLLLLCNEDLSSNLGNKDGDIFADDLKNENEQVFADGNDHEYIQLILEREMIVERETEFPQDSLIQSARLEGIQHILETKDVLGLGFPTAYVSITYLDRFLSKTSIVAEKSWTVRLVAAACLSLAAKMEEKGLPPPLKELFSVECNGCEVQKTELLVLNALEWRMVTVTPFAFIRFFASKFSLPADALSTALHLILASVRDQRIMCHRPSVIAAAATLVVLDQGLTKDAFEISPLNSSHSFKFEDVFSCYDLLQEMEIERCRF